MCRWAAYIGAPVFLEEIVAAPRQSLIAQSMAARESVTETNADGFGLAWYGERAEPGLYRDVYPAWSDPNLQSLAKTVRSPLFLAHVRASTGTATSRNNCHPFVVGKWSFMHNGQVGGYMSFRRRVDMMIPDDLYDQRRGATDSEAIFLLALAEGLERDPKGAFERVIGRLEAMSRTVGAAPHIRLTAAASDGERLFAIRYASDDRAPSLYAAQTATGHAVVSEPFEGADAGWQAIPPGSFVEVTTAGLGVRPFAPEPTVLPLIG